ADLSKSKDFRKALTRLRDSMRTGIFKTGPSQIRLGPLIKAFEAQTAREGFHVLHDWDGAADRLNDDIIPVDVLHFILRAPGVELSPRAIPAILLDYYLAYVLALLSISVWSDGNAGSNLDRLSELLRDLQGPQGSGQTFADNAETLVFIATSHFEPDIGAYGR